MRGPILLGLGWLVGVAANCGNSGLGCFEVDACRTSLLVPPVDCSCFCRLFSSFLLRFSAFPSSTSSWVGEFPIVLSVISPLTNPCKSACSIFTSSSTLPPFNRFNTPSKSLLCFHAMASGLLAPPLGPFPMPRRLSFWATEICARRPSPLAPRPEPESGVHPNLAKYCCPNRELSVYKFREGRQREPKEIGDVENGEKGRQRDVKEIGRIENASEPVE
jgi:hypothetical protein